jgi:hypothetical protein
MPDPLIGGTRWNRAREGIDEEAAELLRVLKALLKQGNADPTLLAIAGLALTSIMDHLGEIDRIASKHRGD